MLVQCLVAATGLLMGAQALPAPEPQGIVVPIPNGIISLGQPKSTLIIGSRDAEPQELGPVSSTITWPGSSTGPIEITPREAEAKPQGIAQSYPNGIISLGQPKSTLIITPKREAEPKPQGIAQGYPNGIISLGQPKSTFIITPKREAVPEPEPQGIAQGFPSAIISLGQPKSTFIINPKREADPQISLGPVTGTLIINQPAPTLNACKCAAGTAPGKYCGFCKQIGGSWVSWNQYQCKAGGACTSLGFNKACVDGSAKQCPGK